MSSKSRTTPPIIPRERRNLGELPSHLKDLPAEYRISIPPGIPSETVELPSTSESNLYYKANLGKVTCNCPSFSRRDLGRFSVNDPRRYCKHIAKRFLRDYRHSLSAHTQLFLENPPSEFIEKLFLESEVAFYICHNGPESEWVNAHARLKKTGEDEGNYSGALARYGFSLSERRWSHDNKPAGAGEIQKLIKARIKSLRSDHAKAQRIEKESRKESTALVESQEDGDDGFGFGIILIAVLSIPLVFIIGCIVT